MSPWSLLPSRCLVCGTPGPSQVCRRCAARCQVRAPADAGLGFCPVCGGSRLAEGGACVDCAGPAWSFPGLEGLFTYHEAAAELLRVYKFTGQPALAPHWAALGAVRLQPPGPLVPVPTTRRRLWHRGWDPVSVLAQALGRRLDQPVLRVLGRRAAAAQKSLDRAGRAANAARTYRLRPGGAEKVAGQPLVWLVDDVVTTGSTAEACARLLREAGVAEVRVFCLGLH